MQLDPRNTSFVDLVIVAGLFPDDTYAAAVRRLLWVIPTMKATGRVI